MSEHPPVFTSSQIKEMKKEARQMARNARVAITECLNKIARRHGFDEWYILLRYQAA